MRLLIIILCLASAACNQPSSESQPTETAAYVPQAITEEAIFVIVHSGLPKYKPEYLDQWWVETKQCLQMEAEPPIVKIATDVRLICSSSNGAVGVHCNNGDGWFIGMTDTHSHIRHEWKHEFIHSIRHQNGLTDHIEHDFSEPYWQCIWN